MASLLSPFNFGGQKHAYFHARITIHELVNVPLVTGHFKARWRVKNVHALQNIPGQLSTAANEGQAERDASGQSSDNLERRSLRQKKSSVSIASQEAESTRHSADATSPIDELFPVADLERVPERKTSNRFLSGFKDAFHSRSRKISTGSARKTEKIKDDVSLHQEGEEEGEGKVDSAHGGMQKSSKEMRRVLTREESEGANGASVDEAEVFQQQNKRGEGCSG
jgi:hypothetical protein